MRNVCVLFSGKVFLTVNYGDVGQGGSKFLPIHFPGDTFGLSHTGKAVTDNSGQILYKILSSQHKGQRLKGHPSLSFGKKAITIR